MGYEVLETIDARVVIICTTTDTVSQVIYPNIETYRNFKLFMEKKNKTDPRYFICWEFQNYTKTMECDNEELYEIIKLKSGQVVVLNTVNEAITTMLYDDLNEFNAFFAYMKNEHNKDNPGKYTWHEYIEWCESSPSINKKRKIDADILDHVKCARIN
jgi:hypothetical protein